MRNNLRDPVTGISLSGPANGNHPPDRQITEVFDELADAAMMDTKQVAELAGRKPATIKAWRREGRGPEWLDINGRPRTTAGLYRTWLAGLAKLPRAG